jgi:hypothetical protein
MNTVSGIENARVLIPIADAIKAAVTNGDSIPE